MLPASALASVAETGLLGNPRQIRRAAATPKRLTSAKPWQGPPPLVDVTSFGEIGLVAARRGENRLPAPIPHGLSGPPAPQAHPL